MYWLSQIIESWMIGLILDSARLCRRARAFADPRDRPHLDVREFREPRAKIVTAEVPIHPLMSTRHEPHPTQSIHSSIDPTRRTKDGTFTTQGTSGS